MGRDLGVDSILLHETAVEVAIVAFGAMQPKLEGGALGRLEALLGDHLADHVLGHLSPGGPLAACNEEATRLRVFADDVIPAHLGQNQGRG